MIRSVKCTKLNNVIQRIKNRQKQNILESESNPLNLSDHLTCRRARQKKTHKMQN